MPGTLSATVIPAAVAQNVAADFGGSGVLDMASVSPKYTFAEAFGGAGNLVAASIPRLTVPAALSGAGNLVATGTQKYFPAAALSASGALTATGVGIIPAFYRDFFASLASFTSRGPGTASVTGGQCVTAQNTGSCYSYNSPLNTDDVTVRAVIIPGWTSGQVFRLYLRANNSHQMYAQVNVSGAIEIGTAVGAYNGGTRTARATGSTAAVGSNGAVMEFRASGNVYTLYIDGVAKLTWTDPGNATYGQVNSTHREVAFASADTSNISNTAFYQFGAWDLATAFKSAKLIKTAATMAWATSATWIGLTGLTPVNDATFTSFNTVNLDLCHVGDKTGATFSASVPFSGSNAARTHTLRIRDVTTNIVIATGTTVTAASGTATVTATADAISGHLYRLEMNSNGTSAGTIAASTPFFSIT